MQVLALTLTLLVGQVRAADPADKKDAPIPLPADVIKAWRDAGAKVGWMKMEESGVLSFVEEPEPGALPAFRLPNWKAGIVAKLPVPKTPFGLDLSKTELPDAGLQELAKLPTLGSLCLCETMVTAEAVAALRKTLPKCYIFHC